MKMIEFDWNKAANSEVVIYGTTVGGKIIFQCLKSRGIEAAFFCDRSERYSEFCGIPVRTPEVLKNQTDYIVLVALTRSFNSACQCLEDWGYKEVYKCCNLIFDRKMEDFECDENEKIAVANFLEKYPIYAGNLEGRAIILPTLEVFITERCTLRCRDCSHLIPRYDKPIDYEITKIIQHLQNVLKIVEKISDLTILGGEPLLHKNISRLLEYCYKQEKIENITIISNGTVMPTDDVLKSMRNTNTRLRLSDYGKYSIRLKELKSRCEQEKITCFINNELWTDMGKIYNHNYTEIELEEMFTDCPFAFALLLLKGKIFRCAHVAHLNNLEIIDSYQHDSVDVNEIREEDIVSKKEELLDYLHISYLKGCSYCNGIKNSIQGIEPAIQGVR